MAGRRREMANRVGWLEELALSLQEDMLAICPKQYCEMFLSDRLRPGDPLSEAWIWVIVAIQEAVFACGELGDRLREKAGITSPGPVERYFWECQHPGEPEPPDDGEAP